MKLNIYNMKILERIKNLFCKEGDITDGYHTFDELYDYRMLYNAAFFNFLAALPGNPYNVHMSFRHSDGKCCFDGYWFIVMANLPTGQVSNHYNVSDLGYFYCVPLHEKAEVWDGHTPDDAKERIAKYIRKYQFRDIVEKLNIKAR